MNPMDAGTAPPKSLDGVLATSPDALEESLRAALAPRFVVLRMVGSGGMARVYLARESALKRLVAVKVLSPHIASSPEARARFEREAQAVASLSHPNIVPIHGVGELPDGTPYFVMQFVNGRSLAARIEEQGPMSVQEARRALGEVAAALAAAHDQGIIHRDIKAANILQEDASGRVLVSDFGIAAVAPRDEPAPMRLTGTGIAVGTPMYMSPEQLLAEPVSEKTDVYALGLLAHELIAGSGPFVASTPGEIIAAHLRDIPKRLSERRAGVDAELDELVARCLEKDASRRPAANEIARRLLPGTTTLLEWPPPGLDALLGGLRDAGRYFWLGGLAVVLAVLPGVVSGIDGQVTNSSSMPSLLVLLAVGGVLSLIVALDRSVRLGVDAARAIRAGYGWTTVLETLSDRNGDTAALIAGAREYAALSADARSRLRTARVASGVLLFCGAVLLVPALIVAVALGSSGMAGVWAIWAALALPALMGAIAIVLAARELRFFILQRRARRSAVPDVELPPLVQPWNESFEAVRAGQSLGRGSPTRPLAWRVITIGGSLLALCAALVIAPLVAFHTIMPRFWGRSVPSFSWTLMRLESASPMRAFVLPKDSTIEPLVAGAALARLYVDGYATPLPSRMSTQREPLPWRAPLAADLFPTARPDFYRGLPSTTAIVAAAAHGFSDREMRFLEAVAHAPIWGAYDTVATAAKVDYFGARFVLPFPSSGTMADFPRVNGADVKSLAYAGVSRGVYYLAKGQRDSAEHALRSVASFGIMMMDQDNRLEENLLGAVIAGIARGALIDFYSAVHDPRGPQLAARQDSVLAAIGRRTATAATAGPDINWANPAASRRETIRAAANTTLPRGLRLQMFTLLGGAPCMDVHELVYGPDAEVRRAFDDARKTWARFPADSAIVDLASRVEHFDVPNRLVPRILSGLTHGTGAILANPRITHCGDAMISAMASLSNE